MQLVKKKIISHKKKMSSIIRCAITSYLIAITLVMIGYVLYIKNRMQTSKAKILNEKIRM